MEHDTFNINGKDYTTDEILWCVQNGSRDKALMSAIGERFPWLKEAMEKVQSRASTYDYMQFSSKRYTQSGLVDAMINVISAKSYPVDMRYELISKAQKLAADVFQIGNTKEKLEDLTEFISEVTGNPLPFVEMCMNYEPVPPQNPRQIKFEGFPQLEDHSKDIGFP